MRPYIRDYINTLSGRRQERVSKVIDDARVSKAELEKVATNLEARSDFTNARIGRIAPDSELKSRSVRENIRSATDRIAEMYDVSNLIALLINTHSKMLLSETRAIESEISTMEKMVDNFAFLLADPEAYNYGYLETFEDGRFRDNELKALSDRSGVQFSDGNLAHISGQDASLVLPDDFEVQYGLMGMKVNSNSTAYTVFETSVNDAVRQSGVNGWKLTIASAGAIHAPIAGAGNTSGAQVELEFRLEQPAACSAIRLRPFADIANELLQVTIFADEQGEGKQLLSEPKTLDRSLMLHFPVQSVLRFRLLLNQPTFKYVGYNDDGNERIYRNVIQEHVHPRNGYVSRYVRVQRKVQEKATSPRGGFGMSAIPNPGLSTGRSGPLGRISDIVKYSDDQLWKGGRKSGSSRIFSAVAAGEFPSGTRENSHHLLREAHYRNDGSALLEHDLSNDVSVSQDGFDYYYDLGLQNVAVGLEAPKYRGVFVSKPFDSSGDIGQVRIKVSDQNALSEDGRDSRYITSVEYSVSNSAKPEGESSWVPILPIGQTRVEGERLFLTEGGLATLRFPATGEGSIVVYRNGYAITSGVEYLRSSLGYITKLRIDRSQYNPEDVLVCDYYPAQDSTLVDFDQLGFNTPSLAAIYDSGGAGEGFQSTGNLNQVQLRRIPFVDPDSNVAPVVVRLDSGEVAENITDYSTRQAVPLPDEGLYFIHQGDTLHFNRPIEGPFRVYYQYLENNVRLRIVLRCNDREFATPQVDYVHVKAKTRNSDVKSSIG